LAIGIIKNDNVIEQDIRAIIEKLFYDQQNADEMFEKFKVLLEKLPIGPSGDDEDGEGFALDSGNEFKVDKGI
jgi:hypothetical protein